MTDKQKVTPVTFSPAAQMTRFCVLMHQCNDIQDLSCLRWAPENIASRLNMRVVRFRVEFKFVLRALQANGTQA